MELMDHQNDAIAQMHNGCVLYGGTGVGKSHTAMGYYIKEVTANPKPMRDLYVITTARKRNSMDWEDTAADMRVFTGKESFYGQIKVDSWNNIENYADVENEFFIFDEQRAVGRGKWAKMFIKIARKNKWILLSATPGDTWSDYAPLFVANGFFKDIREFNQKHVVYKPFVRFPMIESYLGEHKLEGMRNQILVEMPYERHTNRAMNWMDVEHDTDLFEYVWKHRWNIYTEEPCRDIAELYRVGRKLINSDPSRLQAVRERLVHHDRLIVFYNFDYELEILRTLAQEVDVYEYNGHRKDLIANMPETGEWVYLVQYTAGAEAWNCTSTNAILFYSLTYSWRNFHQAMGRIDRLDTLYTDLYYYMLVSNTNIDRNITKSLGRKEDFQERKMAWEEGIEIDRRGVLV